jgi:thiamine kinase-like enzyme
MWCKLFLGPKINDQVHVPKRTNLKNFFHRSISTIMNCDNNSDVIILDVIELASVGRRGLKNDSYLVEFILKRIDGTSEFIKVVAKNVSSNMKSYSYLKTNENYFSRILSIRIPQIIYFDYENGFIFRDFIVGMNLENILQQIFLRKSITNWHKVLFEKMGQGLGELNIKLEIVHGDSRTTNWIYEKENKDLFLIDWDNAGRGDPAYDLSKLIYSIGRKFSKFIYDNDLETQDKIINLFDEICFAIISGYSKVDLDHSIIKHSTNYWTQYLFSVNHQIHERIFYHCFHFPRKFRFLRMLIKPIVSIPSIKGNYAIKLFQKISKLVYSIVLNF